MTTSLAFCANTGVSLIDLPPTEPSDDPQASPQAAVQCHFGPDTGSRYWLNRAKTLEFNPLTDVKTCENLLDDPVNEPTVANVHVGHQPRYLLALQIPTTLPRGLPHAQQRLHPRLRAAQPTPSTEP
jgi:hypothetical protein